MVGRARIQSREGHGRDIGADGLPNSCSSGADTSAESVVAAKAAYAAQNISALSNCAVLTPRPFYNEFLVGTPLRTAELRHRLVEKKILAGVPFLEGAPFENSLLLAFTEQNTREEIDQLITALAEVTA